MRHVRSSSAAHSADVQDAGLEPAVLQTFGGRLDVSVERAVCQLLLGDPDAAESALGMAPRTGDSPDPGVLQFVLVRVCGALCCSLGVRNGLGLRASDSW